MKKSNNELQRLKKYLSSEPEAKLKLCFALGYVTPTTIDKWLTKGEIPRIAKRHVVEYLERET